MPDNIIMRIVSHRLIVPTININSSVAGFTTTFTPGSTFIVQHQIPDNDAFTPIVYRTKSHLAHILHQTSFQVASVIPHADRSFRKDKFFIGTFLLNVIQFLTSASIVVISSSGKESSSHFIIIHSNRILLLIGHIIIVVIMVESINLRIQSGSLESRTESIADKSLFFFPTHEQRSRITPI